MRIAVGIECECFMTREKKKRVKSKKEWILLLGSIAYEPSVLQVACKDLVPSYVLQLCNGLRALRLDVPFRHHHLLHHEHAWGRRHAPVDDREEPESSPKKIIFCM